MRNSVRKTRPISRLIRRDDRDSTPGYFATGLFALVFLVGEARSEQAVYRVYEQSASVDLKETLEMTWNAELGETWPDR